ncbi:hypothetical protein ACVIU7_004630 [Bradyrhizobium liaoningense]
MRLVIIGAGFAGMSYRQILVTAGPVRRRRFWAHGQPCLAMTSIPSLNVTPSTSFGNWL